MHNSLIGYYRTSERIKKPNASPGAAIGVSSTVSGTTLTIQSNSTNATTYRQSFSASATESVAITTPTFGWQEATIAGTKTAGNVLSLVVFDSALAGGKETVTYSVLSTDTLTSMATGLAAAVNADTNLQAIGVTATSSAAVVSIESLSPNLTTYSQSVTSGGTETIALGITTGVMQASYNDVNELVSLAPGGATQFQGTTDKPVKNVSLNSQVVNIQSTVTEAASSTYSGSATSTPSETLTFASVPAFNNAQGYVWSCTVGGTAKTGDVISLTFYETRFVGGSHVVYYTVQAGDTTTTIANSINNVLDLDPILYVANITGAGSNANVFYIRDNSVAATGPSSLATIGNVTGFGSETVSFAYNADQNYAATIGGVATVGDVVSLTVENGSLTGGQETVLYTVATGNTLTNIATGLTAAINADANLKAIGVASTSSGAVATLLTDTYYTSSTSGGATETIALGTNNRGNVSATIGGKPTTGDTVTISAHNPLLTSGVEAVTYTVLSTDTALTIANGLAAAVNADTQLQTLGVSAPTNSATLAWSQQFSGNANLPVGASIASATAIDGGSNSKTNGYALSVNSGLSTSLTFDANGNMTSDGTNSYVWDAKNRLVSIVYSGSGNHSNFTYDGSGHTAEILEYTGATLTSTKQFVWDFGNVARESRDSSSSIISQFFRLGQMDGNNKRFYNLNQIVSITEVTDNSGTLIAQLTYSPFGQPSQLQGSYVPDFGFAGYYVHGRSGLNLTRTRAYSSNSARFINRDIVDLKDGSNSFVYANGNPVNLNDPSGLRPLTPDEKGFIKKWFPNCFSESKLDTGFDISDTPFRSTSFGNGSIFLNGNAKLGELGHEVYHVEQASEMGNLNFLMAAGFQQAAAIGSQLPIGQPWDISPAPPYNPYAFDSNQPILPQFINGNVEMQGQIIEDMINAAGGDPRNIPSAYRDTYNEILKRCCKKAKK